MNTIQKMSIIIGVMAFCFWLFLPIEGFVEIFLHLWDQPERWFYDWDNILSFVIVIGCGLVYHLFKDKEEPKEII